MPFYQHDNTSIYYEVRGAGYPLLLLPPGGMSATIDFWQRTAFNAVEIFSEHFRVIALDQRNSGRSSGPFGIGDPWEDYLTDHVGLLNHLGIEQCHVLGCCIGASYALRLAHSAPERVKSLVLEQPVGADPGNRQAMPNAWREWADTMIKNRSDVDMATLETLGRRMWEGDFVLSVSREDVKACKVPMLVLPGVDLFHPPAVAHEIIALARDVEVIDPWKEPATLIPRAVSGIRDFLRKHTPG